MYRPVVPETILLTIFFTITLLLFKNHSGFSSRLIIPIIVSLLAKYMLGDWDNGFQWTLIDIAYWVSVIIISYITIRIWDIYNV